MAAPSAYTDTLALAVNLTFEDTLSDIIFDDEIALREQLRENEDDGLLDDIEETRRPFDDTVVRTTETLRLHRGHVLMELEDYFMSHPDFDMRSTTLCVEMVLPNGKLEAGEDAGRVMRDALSEYWEDFYLKRTAGHIIEVPTVCHSVDGERWKVVEKNISVGYYYHKYVPIQLSPALLDYCVQGDTIPTSFLMEQLLEGYLSESGRVLANTALTSFTDVDQDELLDFLSDYKVATKPSQTNIRSILKQLAHREIIQKPIFMAQQWQVELLINMLPILPSASFNNLPDMRPTFKKVWGYLQFHEEDNSQPSVNFLKKYLKEASTITLQAFLDGFAPEQLYSWKNILQ